MSKKTKKATHVAKLSTSNPNVRIMSRFTGYSTDDCDCKWCLFYGDKKKGCMIDVCCCLEERAQALERETKNKNGGRVNEQM